MTDQPPTPEQAERQGLLVGMALHEYSEGNGAKCFEYLDEFVGNEKGAETHLLFTLARSFMAFEGINYGHHGFELQNLVTGKTRNPDEVFHDPASDGALATWCIRFIVALSNEQIDQCFALLAVTPSEEVAAGRMHMMIHLTSAAMQQYIEAHKS